MLDLNSMVSTLSCEMDVLQYHLRRTLILPRGASKRQEQLAGHNRLCRQLMWRLACCCVLRILRSEKNTNKTSSARCAQHNHQYHQQQHGNSSIQCRGLLRSIITIGRVILASGVHEPQHFVDIGDESKTKFLHRRHRSPPSTVFTANISSNGVSIPCLSVPRVELVAKPSVARVVSSATSSGISHVPFRGVERCGNVDLDAIVRDLSMEIDTVEAQISPNPPKSVRTREILRSVQSAKKKGALVKLSTALPSTARVVPTSFASRYLTSQHFQQVGGHRGTSGGFVVNGSGRVMTRVQPAVSELLPDVKPHHVTARTVLNNWHVGS